MRLGIALLAPFLACAQEETVALGANLFRTTCAAAYCHGAAGAAGRAPQLAGRVFTLDRLTGVIRDGIPKTGMPGFKNEMRDDWIRAVALYVQSLSGPAAVATGKPVSRVLPAEAQHGRALFFDSSRMGGCGTCHAADGWGTPVGPSLTRNIPAGAAALREYRATRVISAQSRNEDSFPALAVVSSSSIVTLYDLSTPLPVLRTFAASAVHTAPGANWNHSALLNPYSDTELESILAFLRALR